MGELRAGCVGRSVSHGANDFRGRRSSGAPSPIARRRVCPRFKYLRRRAGLVSDLRRGRSGADEPWKSGPSAGIARLVCAVPPAEGRLITLEIDPKHAAVARANLGPGRVGEQVDRLGPAAESLAQLAAERGPAFDLISFIAEQTGYSGYFESALRLSRVGTLFVADNVVRKGAIADPSRPVPAVLGSRGSSTASRRSLE